MRDGELYFLYSYHPLVILKYDAERGDVRFTQVIHASYEPRSFPFLICGSSPGLEVADGYLFVAHRRSVRLPDMRRAYMSRLYRLDRGISALLGGPYFVIDKPTIQFINGFVLDGTRAYVTYGNEDHSAHLAAFSANDFLNDVA